MEETYELPEFDMGISTLGRINFELFQLNNAKRADDVVNWFKALDNIYCEVESHIKDKDAMDHTIIYEKILLEYDKYLRLMENSYKLNGMKPRISRTLFILLRQWELKLRRENYMKNLLMRMGDDASRAMI